MPTVLVRGLTEEGPGDVVGAFAGVADVDPDRIGNIDIDGAEARVDLDLEDEALDSFLEAEENPEGDVPREHLRDVIVGLEDPEAAADAATSR